MGNCQAATQHHHQASRHHPVESTGVPSFIMQTGVGSWCLHGLQSEYSIFLYLLGALHLGDRAHQMLDKCLSFKFTLKLWASAATESNLSSRIRNERELSPTDCEANRDAKAIQKKEAMEVRC